MKDKKNTRDGRRGSALLAMVGLVLISSMFVATLTSVSLARSFTAKKLADRLRAGAIAEAGAATAYNVLVNDFGQRTNAAAFPTTAYAGGSYELSVSAISTDGVSIRSTGVYGSVTEVVLLDVRRSDGGAASTGSTLYDYAILAGGEISWTGASAFYGGAGVHSNGEFTRSGSGYLQANVASCIKFKSNGNSGGVDGDVAAPTLQGNLSHITGTATEDSVPLVEIPDIDLTPYYQEALANGEVHNGDLSLSSSYAPDGGILWVKGDLHLSGTATFTGCFIATGDIVVSGGGSIEKVGDYPTLVSRDGDIKFTGQKDVEGLIYVKMGDYQQAGGNTLTGQIIVRGDVSKSGSSTVINYADCTPIAPGEIGGGGGGIIGVTAWQQ